MGDSVGNRGCDIGFPWIRRKVEEDSLEHTNPLSEAIELMFSVIIDVLLQTPTE